MKPARSKYSCTSVICPPSRLNTTATGMRNDLSRGRDHSAAGTEERSLVGPCARGLQAYPIALPKAPVLSCVHVGKGGREALVELTKGRAALDGFRGGRGEVDNGFGMESDEPIPIVGVQRIDPGVDHPQVLFDGHSFHLLLAVRVFVRAPLGVFRGIRLGHHKGRTFAGRHDRRGATKLVPSQQIPLDGDRLGI